MKVKDIILSCLFTVLMMVSVVCSAQISVEDLNIGGIYYGMPMEDVVSQYGQPAEVIQETPKSVKYRFKLNESDVFVSFDKNALVKDVSVSNSGVSTVAGAMVGMSVEDVISIYGTPTTDEVLPIGYGEGISNARFLTYACNEKEIPFPYGVMKRVSFLRFRVSSDNIISSMVFYTDERYIENPQ